MPPTLHFKLPCPPVSSISLGCRGWPADLHLPNRWIRPRTSCGVPMGRAGPPIEMKISTPPYERWAETRNKPSVPVAVKRTRRCPTPRAASAIWTRWDISASEIAFSIRPRTSPRIFDLPKTIGPSLKHQRLSPDHKAQRLCHQQAYPLRDGSRVGESVLHKMLIDLTHNGLFAASILGS